MAEGEGRERLWLRPLGLLALGVAFALGQPFVLAAVPFALLGFALPGAGFGGLFLGAVALALVFAGEPGSGFWYLERGWAILAGGWFVAFTLAWPDRPFLPRALGAVAGGTAQAGALLWALGGWSTAEWLVRSRIEASVGATLELLRAFTREGVDPALSGTVATTAEAQSILFPALLALATVAMLGVAWWAHVKLATGSGRGLEGLRSFRFPDPLIWVLIAGIALLLAAEWTGGWGRVGANMAVFMGGLYALRGAGVLVFLAGGMSLLGGLVVAVGMVLAGPVLVAAAMAVGVGDSWWDLRARATAARSDGGDR